MNDFNIYNQKDFEVQFSQTEIYKKLCKDFDIVCFGEDYTYDEIKGTPREWYGSKNKRTVFSAIPFYYIEFLTRHNPDTIYDIGCGWNIFKKYIPNIIGIAGEIPGAADYYGDQHGFVNDEYIQSHQQYFESAFSINALHFIHLSNLRKQVFDIVSMIKPGGRLFLSFNVARMLPMDSNFRRQSVEQVDQWIRTQLDDVSFIYEVFEVNYAKCQDDWMNGNIRMVIWNKTT